MMNFSFLVHHETC